MPNPENSHFLPVVNEELFERRLKTVYHYTSRAGCVGILDSGELWATDVRFMNDTAETRYGRACIGEVLAGVVAHDPDGGRMQEAVNRVAGVGRIAPYMICFCENGDELSQWRAYSGQGGYALRFTPDYLRALSGSWHGSMLLRVEYSLKEQRRMARRLVDSFANRVAAIPPSEWKGEVVGNVGRAFVLAGVLLSQKMKHPSFHEEREWRLVGWKGVDEKVHYRNGRSLVTPFMPIPLNPGGRIMRKLGAVAGPTPHEDLALSVMREMVANALGVHERKIGGKHFTNSKIPYRDW